MTEMTDETKDILYTALLSYLCSIGDPLPDIFKNNKDIGDAFKLVSPKLKTEETMPLKFTLNEVSPIGGIDIDKRAEERVEKHINPVGEKLGQLGPRHGDIAKHAMTSRGKHNTPRSVRNQFGLQKINNDLKECLDFLKNNLKKSKAELKELLENFPHKVKLFALVDHILATSMGGWKAVGNKLVNETGHEASPENWVLLENGKLATLNKNSPDIDVDNLYNIRILLDG